MAKPAMIIDLITGPKHGEEPDADDEESPLDDEEDPEDRARTKDPLDLIASLEAQLAELRRSIGG